MQLLDLRTAFHHVRSGLVLITAGFSLALAATATAQEPQASSTVITDSIIVSGQELPSAYGAPPGFSRTRFAPITTAYVLPPASVLAATIYEGDSFRHGAPSHSWTQEIEVGLPHRFGVAVEAELEHFGGITQGRSVSLEGRYALADWNKIPLNPTVFAEYKFGLGRILKDEALNQPRKTCRPRRLSAI